MPRTAVLVTALGLAAPVTLAAAAPPAPTPVAPGGGVAPTLARPTPVTPTLARPTPVPPGGGVAPTLAGPAAGAAPALVTVPRDAKTSPPDDPIAIEATEYAYAGIPARLPRGTARFSFTNAGKELHEALVVRVAPGATLRQALDQGLEGRAAKVLAFTAAKPGKAGKRISVKLTPGRYAVVCLIPDAKKRPHADRGQIARFRVR